MTLLGDKPQELIILVAGTDTQYLPTTSDLVTALLLSAYELTSVGCNLREIWKYLSFYTHNVIPQIKSHIILLFSD